MLLSLFQFFFFTFIVDILVYYNCFPISLFKDPIFFLIDRWTSRDLSKARTSEYGLAKFTEGLLHSQVLHVFEGGVEAREAPPLQRCFCFCYYLFCCKVMFTFAASPFLFRFLGF